MSKTIIIPKKSVYVKCAFQMFHELGKMGFPFEYPEKMETDRWGKASTFYLKEHYLKITFCPDCDCYKYNQHLDPDEKKSFDFKRLFGEGRLEYQEIKVWERCEIIYMDCDKRKMSFSTRKLVKTYRNDETS